jgi:hypothetical protein
VLARAGASIQNGVNFISLTMVLYRLAMRASRSDGYSVSGMSIGCCARASRTRRETRSASSARRGEDGGGERGGTHRVQNVGPLLARSDDVGVLEVPYRRLGLAGAASPSSSASSAASSRHVGCCASLVGRVGRMLVVLVVPGAV